ncbi:MAG TPA: site-specific DNA-methyltransferase [Anaerolineales bacterium]|jgi:DNA modification methylase
MPILHWNGKNSTPPQPAMLTLDSVTYAQTAPASVGVPANRLFLGDNLSIMSALLPEYEGRVNLIYADPPFFTNRHFNARIGRGEDSRKPREWQLAAGYADQWDNPDAYIDFLYQRLAVMVRLLAANGTLYLHLDWHADAYARLVLDELLGSDNFVNEIIWAYHGPSPIRSAFNRKHDTILMYTKGANYTFNADAVRVPYNQATVKTFAASKKAGFGKIPDLERGKVPEDWWYFPVVARLHGERTGYPTQKPEALLERMILASSNPGDLVADFFCGSGTTPLVAARHGRHFLAADATFRAIHITRERLVRAGSEPFAIYRTGVDGTRLPAGAEFAFQRADGEIRLTGAESPSYWEIDPAWDGSVFRSCAQAVLPLRRGEIPHCLPLTNPAGKVCIRAVTGGGEQVQYLVEE